MDDVKRLKALAAGHFRNSTRLARRLVAAENELRRLKAGKEQDNGLS